jgi:hypothetical protein
MTTKVIDGKKMVEVPFTITYNLCIEEHQYLQYVTGGIPLDIMAQAGKETLLGVLKPRMDEINENWSVTMIEVAQ